MTRLLMTLVCLTLAAPAHAQIMPSFPGQVPPDTAVEVQGLAGARSIRLPEWLFPLRSKEAIEGFYGTGGLSTLQTVLANGFEDRASIYAELVSDTFGPVRVALGSTISTGKDTQESTAESKAETQSFFAGGGNVTLSGALPVLLLASSASHHNRFIVYALPKLGANIPGIGTQSTDFSAVLDAGFEAHGQITSDKEEFAFFGQARGAWASGNDAFDQGIGRAAPFWYVQWTAGVEVKETVRLSVSGIGAPKSVKDRFGPVTLGVSLVPQREKKPKK